MSPEEGRMHDEMMHLENLLAALKADAKRRNTHIAREDEQDLTQAVMWLETHYDNSQDYRAHKEAYGISRDSHITSDSDRAALSIYVKYVKASVRIS